MSAAPNSIMALFQLNQKQGSLKCKDSPESRKEFGRRDFWERHEKLKNMFGNSKKKRIGSQDNLHRHLRNVMDGMKINAQSNLLLLE